MLREFRFADVIVIQPRLCNVFVLDTLVRISVDEDEIPAEFAEDDARNHVRVEFGRDRKSIHIVLSFMIGCCYD